MGADPTTLLELLAGIQAPVTAFSGGVDSALVAWLAVEARGEAALAVTADSPSLARAELAAATDFAATYGLRHLVVGTAELDDERYVRNHPDRCARCKAALMVALDAVTLAAGGGQVLLGVNLDDLGDHRPGQAVARARGARFPLVEAGFTKAAVRELSRELGLPTWDKPAAACLASRLAYGVPVTRAALARVEAAEAGLRELGFGGRVRVRDQGGDLARIETDANSIGQVLQHRLRIVEALKAAGFRYVTLDLEGYRQGSHNAVLVELRAPGRR
jgi:pyridinium-3,5-biscarboxylic acid mononucleotide sulfurtransferase